MDFKRKSRIRLYLLSLTLVQSVLSVPSKVATLCTPRRTTDISLMPSRFQSQSSVVPITNTFVWVSTSSHIVQSSWRALFCLNKGGPSDRYFWSALQFVQLPLNITDSMQQFMFKSHSEERMAYDWDICNAVVMAWVQIGYKYQSLVS